MRSSAPDWSVQGEVFKIALDADWLAAKAPHAGIGSTNAGAASEQAAQAQSFYERFSWGRMKQRLYEVVDAA